jgi:catechol 2,3-dioxygenase-like lactoylglutathione lyase family enzyme
MRKHLEGLDHVVIRVADLDRAADDFRALGFTLTPRGRHSLGTENHCAMFGFDYLELLRVPPGVAPPFYADFPLTGDGMTGLALKSTDAAALRAAWERADLHPDPLVEFSRPVDSPAGTGVDAPSRPTAHFRVVALPADRTPGGRAFACEHRTPELVWRPGSRQHANHVTGINKVVIATDDPQAAGILWGRVFDVAPHPIPGGISITTGAAPIVALTPDAIARQLPRVELPALPGPARFAAIYLTTNDLSAAVAIVRGSGFPTVALPDGTWAVPCAVAHGVTLVFR